MTTRHRLYLCGPMTGLPEFNYPAFARAASQLRACGYSLFNPTENGLPAHAPWVAHMRRDIPELLLCAGVATLPGIENSRGARLELRIATDLHMPVATVEDWIAAAHHHGAHHPQTAYSPMTGEPL